MTNVIFYYFSGLFCKAISQSGSALSWWAFAKTSSAVDRAFSLARLLGLTTEDPCELLEFLQKQPALELVKLMGRTSSKEVHILLSIICPDYSCVSVDHHISKIMLCINHHHHHHNQHNQQ